MAGRKIDDGALSAQLARVLEGFKGSERIEADLGLKGFMDRLLEALKDPANRPDTAKRVWDTKATKLCLRVRESGAAAFYVQWSRTGSAKLGTPPGLTVERARIQALAQLVSANDAKDGIPEMVRQKREAIAEARRTIFTVADAGREYVRSLRRDKRTAAAADAERRFERVLYHDPLGAIEFASLTLADVEAWRDRMEAGIIPNLPAKRGRPTVPKPMSPASFKRTLTALKAALNAALDSDDNLPETLSRAWSKVKPEAGADRRRDLYLTREQRRALLDACAGGLRDLVECVILTGCRPGDPARMRRSDYQVRNGRGFVTFRTKGHERCVPLSPQAQALFDRLAKDKLPTAYLFTKDNGHPWAAHDWRDAFKEAVQAAGLPPETVLYTLRHSWITDAITGGIDLLTVAKLAGTSLAMIEKHYGHLVEDRVPDQLAAIQMM